MYMESTISMQFSRAVFTSAYKASFLTTGDRRFLLVSHVFPQRVFRCAGRKSQNPVFAMTSLLNSGSIALVTGGASGLGAAAAQNFASRGIVTYVLDLAASIDKVDNSKAHKLVHYRTADVTDEDQVKAVIDEISTKHHRLDIVVTSAGINLNAPLFDFKTGQPQPLEDITRAININLTGTLNTIRLAVGLMSRNKPDTDGQRGLIITLSSVSRQSASAGRAVYGATKAGVSSLSVPLAREFASVGIRVVAIAPGPMATPLNAAMPGLDKYEKMMPSLLAFPKRMGTMEEFTKTVDYVVDNTYVNATTLDMAAGCSDPPYWPTLYDV